MVFTFHDDQQANGLLRNGQLTAVVDEDYDASSFEAADAMAQLIAKKKVPPSDTGAGYDGHQMYYYPVITKANNPPAGKFVGAEVRRGELLHAEVAQGVRPEPIGEPDETNRGPSGPGGPADLAGPPAGTAALRRGPLPFRQAGSVTRLTAVSYQTAV